MISKATIVTLLREAAQIADSYADLFRSLGRHGAGRDLTKRGTAMRQAAADLEKTGVGPS